MLYIPPSGAKLFAPPINFTHLKKSGIFLELFVENFQNHDQMNL